MPNKLISMSKVRSLLRLYTEGVSKTAIAKRLGLPRNTIKKYIRLFLASGEVHSDLEQMSDGNLEQLFLDMVPRKEMDDDPKYMALLSFFPEMERTLKRKGVTKEQMWRRYRDQYPDGYGLSQFKHYYLLWHKASNPVMHIEHKSGDKMYVDYAGEKLQMVNPTTGELIDLEVFVSVLGGSQLFYVEASMSQQTEDFITSCENALHCYGGSPQAIVTDNLKAAVVRSNRYEPVLNDAFSDFASHYTMAVVPARPYRPTHKALVEGAVKIIYREIYEKIRSGVFSSLDSINKAIRELVDDFNRRPMSGRPYSRWQVFEETEAASLQPLPLRRYEIKRRKVVTVMKNNFVYLGQDKHYYSVPYQFIGKKVTLFYSQSLVEVYYRHDRIAVHDRDRSPYKYSTVEDHLASKHRYQTDWHPDKFIQKGEEIGPACRDYILGIIESRQHPEQAYKSCQGVLSFAARAGHKRLNDACKRAMQYGDYSYHTIRIILEKGYDKSFPVEELPSTEIPAHENIRGKDYYH